MTITIGIIGGSGLYDMAELTGREERRVETPFGEPSAPYVIGTLGGRRVAFLARHGAGHRLLPTEINYRANIFGFKKLGAEFILSASAVGSLKEQYRPLDILIPDQFVDRTKGRISTFFGRGLVAHVGFAHPFCARLSGLAYDAAVEAGVRPAASLSSGAEAGTAVAAMDDAGLKVDARPAGLEGARVHRGGVYVCMEGPQFSTLAESQLYRSWGMDVIGMTNLQEAKLAREAEICYATIALITDYDCWHPDHDQVTVDLIVATLMQNARTAQQVIAGAVARLPFDRTCACASALAQAIITRPEAIPADVKQELAPIVGKYLS
ncbi:MAG: S-methyl-5'-thioadenosine phosphorylase [Acidobacteriota bacterium]